jgi:nitroreductase
MPATQNVNDLIEQLKWRYACKKFDPTKKIPAEIWSQLEQALVLAPSSYGLQPWKFFVVMDPKLKEQLPAFSWNQPQPKDCSHFVVLAIKKEFGPADVDRLVNRIVEVTGAPRESFEGYRGMMLGSVSRMSDKDKEIWNRSQVYIALGQFMAAAATIGVDTCPMEGFIAEKYDELLGLDKKGYHAVVCCAAGYRAADDAYAARPKVRYATHEVVEHL